MTSTSNRNHQQEELLRLRSAAAKLGVHVLLHLPRRCIESTWKTVEKTICSVLKSQAAGRARANYSASLSKSITNHVHICFHISSPLHTPTSIAFIP